MKRLTLAEFRERSGEFAAAVDATPDVSKFCSGPHWQIAAHDFLHPAPEDRAHFIVEDEGTWLVFAEGEQARVFFPFESAWMFGCPLIGDPGRAVGLLTAARQWLPRPSGFCIGGILTDSPLHEALRKLRPWARQYQEFPSTDCMILDLEDGVEGWLNRRSRKFRRTLRDAESGRGIEIVTAGEATPEAHYRRLLRIQERTYKWLEGTDIFQMPDYAAFYQSLLAGLQNRGEMRLLFAQRDGEDVAYIFGGVAGGTYRGLQMSYIEDVRSLGLGNRLQLENLRHCQAEGITRYDLGMHSPYKERWADRREMRSGVFVVM